MRQGLLPSELGMCFQSFGDFRIADKGLWACFSGCLSIRHDAVCWKGKAAGMGWDEHTLRRQHRGCWCVLSASLLLRSALYRCWLSQCHTQPGTWHCPLAQGMQEVVALDLVLVKGRE